MKIAFVVPSWPPGSAASGIVTYASQMVPALRDLGHDIFIITPRKHDRDPRTIDLSTFVSPPSILGRAVERFVPGTVAWRKETSAIHSAVSLLIRLHGLEVLEIEESFGLALSSLRLLPVVIRLHGPWFLNGPFYTPSWSRRASARKLRLEGRAIKKAAFVTAPSIEVLQAVRSRYSLNLMKACVIPNSIQPAAEKDRWSIKTCDPNKILFIGRFDKLKGGDLVIRAFAELASIYDHLTLTFIGPDFGVEGPDHKTLSFGEFLNLHLPKASRSRVEFCGQVPHSNLADHRRASLLTIVASQREIMPYSVLEAMSLGCPIVATGVGGIPEMIQHRHNGLLVQSQEPRAMADACKILIDDPALAEAIGHQSWVDCCDRYSPTVVAKQTVAAYRKATTIFESTSPYSVPDKRATKHLDASSEEQ